MAMAKRSVEARMVEICILVLKIDGIDEENIYRRAQ